MRGSSQLSSGSSQLSSARVLLCVPTLKHARFLSFEKKSGCHFSDIEFFAKGYKNAATLETVNHDLYDKFINYQLLRKEDIPSSVWETALVKEHMDGQAHSRIDVIWGCISDMKTSDSCNSLRFPHLSAIARLVLTLPHSSAGEEHVFSLIRLNNLFL